MENLDNYLLIDAYKKALELNLNEDFIELLKNELHCRGVELRYQLVSPLHSMGAEDS